MKRRTILLAALVTVAVLGGLAGLIILSHVPPEPVYQRKKLSEWLRDGITVSSEGAVRQIGVKAIPTLLRMARAHDSRLKLKLIGLAQKYHLMKIYVDPSPQWNREGMTGFCILGSDASNAVPALIRIFEQNNSDSSLTACARSLGAIGPAAVTAAPALLRTVTNTNANAKVRAVAVMTLGEIHAEPKFVAPALIKCLMDPDRVIREYAVMDLKLLGSDVVVAVPELIKLLNDPDDLVRFNAAQALKAIDPETAAKAGVK